MWWPAGTWSTSGVGARANPNGPEAQALMAMSLLDDIANNGDRKVIHVMVDAQGKPWLIDHGLELHTQDKLKSACWDYQGQAIPTPFINDLARVAAELRNPNWSCGARSRPALAGQHRPRRQDCRACWPGLTSGWRRGPSAPFLSGGTPTRTPAEPKAAGNCLRSPAVTRRAPFAETARAATGARPD